MRSIHHFLRTALMNRTVPLAAMGLGGFVGLASTALAAEPVRSRDGTLVISEPDDGIDDYATIDDGIGPDPGVDGDADDLTSEKDPVDPADDFTTLGDPFDPADDLITEATTGEVWLSANNPWHAMARLAATRVFQWYPSPVAPRLGFKVDPANPVELNANLELSIHVLPGYDYDFYFCIGAHTFDDGDLRIGYVGLDQEAHFKPDGTLDNCDAWGSIQGPERDGVAAWQTITLGVGSVPSDVTTWEVTAVGVVATPK